MARLKAFLRDTQPVAQYSEVATYLARDIDAVAGSIELGDATAFPQIPFIAELRDGFAPEYVLVSARAAGGAWSVQRGYAGTAPRNFRAGATVAWMPVVHQRGTVLNGEPLGDAAVQLIRHPAGVAGSDPLQLLAARFDQAAPVYITQGARLTRYGAVLTTNLPPSGAATFGVDATAGFPQDGEFLVHIASEDLRVRVAGPTTLAVVDRGVNGTPIVQVDDAATALYQVVDVDNRNGGTQSFLVAGGLNSGLRYLGVAHTVGPLVEYMPKQPLTLNFEFDGATFELLAFGNIGALLMIDGVVQHAPNRLVEPLYPGTYWHRFDFGSRKPRRITLLLSAYPMAIAHAPGDTMRPWDRSAEPLISWDGDSFGQTEGYTWSSQPNGGGLGFFLETMLEMGFTQLDYAGSVGGTGYAQEGPPALPTYPRPKYAGAARVASIAAGPAPLLFIGALGHNDNAIDAARFTADARAYWAALRRAWPDTVLVATQFYFPAAGTFAPEAFLANPLSVARDALIQEALAAAGGAWIYVNTNQGSWMNSRGAHGNFATAGQPLLTGTGYGDASGYRGGHATGIGNGDLMIRDDGVHPSNLGARHLGTGLATAIRAAVEAL